MVGSLSTYSYMHIISKNIYLITLYKLGDNLLCVVIDGQKFQEYSTYNDVSLDQQFMVEMLSYVANSLFLSSYWLLEYQMSDIDCALYDTSRMLPLHN